MKILIYTNEFPPSAGGAGVYSYGLAKELSNLGQEVTVLTRRYTESDSALDRQEKFKIIRRSDKILALYLVYYLKKLKPDHVLATNRIAQIDSSKVRMLLPFKYSVIVHGSEVIIHPQSAQPYKRLWEKATWVMPVSEYTKKLLVSAAEIPEEKISIVYGGVDLERFSGKSSAEELKNQLGISGHKVILTLARISHHKGQDMVIKSLPQIIKCVPDVKYVIAGNGEYLGKLQDLVKEYQLNDHVIFAGYVPSEELSSYYDICDVFVMPSRHEGNDLEGLGLTFLEANARGKPVIGGNHGGVPEAIVHGKTGILVDSYSTDDISNAIIKLLSDNELCQKLGRQAKERVFSDFSWKNTAKKVLELIG